LDPVAGTIALLKNRGFARARIGVELNSQFLPAGVFARLRDGLPKAQWVNAADVLDRAKLIKSPAEIDYVRQAGMVFHCSTSLRDLGHYGLTASETLRATDHGCEVLTSLPRMLTIRK